MTGPLYRLGYDVLGPVFAGFARLLLHQAKQDQVTRLAFVARDGDFLRDVTERLIRRLNPASPPALDYVYLSRVSTILAQYSSFQRAAEAEAESIFGARRTDIAAFLAYFGIDARDVQSVLVRHSLDASTEMKTLEPLQSVLNDRQFVDFVERERENQKELLAAYLEQTALLRDPRVALVDLGWRGSIPAAIANTFKPSRLRSYLFGYWDEWSRRSLPNLEGVLSDHRRRRVLVEGSAYYAAYILEAICRAPHGTVLGFRRESNGTIAPILADDPRQRDRERIGEQGREPIRQGIYDFIDTEGERYRNIEPRAIRRDAQRRLFRLAFFPSNTEIEAVSELAHTEGHAPEWSRSLIDPQRPSPIRSPRRWLAGLASPWRAGYVKATGGWPLTLAFVAAESILTALPSLRRGVRNLALALARQS